MIQGAILKLPGIISTTAAAIFSVDRPAVLLLALFWTIFFFALGSRQLAALRRLTAAVDEMKVRPKDAKPNKEYADPDWLHRAWKVREKYPISDADAEGPCLSVGIPTWLYGHEPPNAFATQIAKCFANSVREDGLLTIAKSGIQHRELLRG